MSGSIYEAALAQASEARGELSYVEVPEWIVNGEPAKVYFYQNLTVDEHIKLSEEVDLATGEQTAEFDYNAARWTLRDEKGALLFGNSAQYRVLREKYDAVVVKQILTDAKVIDRFITQGVAAAKKRLPTTP